MAKNYKDFDDSDGVWRTVGGRRIFIRNGQDLASAMVESGKFKNLRSTYKKGKEEKAKEEYEKDIKDYYDLKSKSKYLDEYEDKLKELMNKYDKSASDINGEANKLEVADAKAKGELTKDDASMLRSIYTYSNEKPKVEDSKYYKDLVDKYGKELVAEKYKELQDKYDIVEGTYTDSEGVTYNTLKEKKDKSNDELRQTVEEQAKKTGVWEKQPDGTFKANKDAMKKQYEENHKKYDAKIKQFVEDRKNMTNGDWEGMLMAYEQQNADGTYKTLQDIMGDVDKYEKVNDRKFKASMGEVDIPDDFEAQFNDYAKGREEKERLDVAKDIAKEVYGLNDKNASPERIEKEARRILEYSDGEVLEKGDQPYTNSKGELERSTKSLKEWRDELKKTSENKDGFTQQTDMYGGTYEYTQQRLNEMKEHGAKPLEHSYTGGGWQGLKYDSTLSTKDIAKNINDYSKKEFPDVKLSRKTDYNGIDMYVMSSDKDMFVSEKDIDNMNFSDLEQVTRSNGFNWWAKENVKDYNTNRSYSIDDVRKYAKEQLNTTKSHDSNPSSDSWYLSDYGKKVISGLNKEMNSYNYDDSDGMVDYFNTNFYGYVHIGKWDKPYQVNQKSSASDINGAIRQKAYQKYLKEHPNSNMSFEDFKDMRK